MALNKVKIDNGVFLDDLRLQGVKSYSITHVEGADYANLTLCMDVTTLQNNHSNNGVDITKMLESFENSFNRHL